VLSTPALHATTPLFTGIGLIAQGLALTFLSVQPLKRWHYPAFSVPLVVWARRTSSMAAPDDLLAVVGQIECWRPRAIMHTFAGGATAQSRAAAQTAKCAMRYRTDHRYPDRSEVIVGRLGSYRASHTSVDTWLFCARLRPDQVV